MVINWRKQGMPGTDKMIKSLMSNIQSHHRNQPEYYQAVHETLQDIIPFIQKQTEYQYSLKLVLERLFEPDQIITFRVSWDDDKGNTNYNRGYRIQHCNALGPYKGGLRFRPNVNLSILKFLAYEQSFKNSLTGLPLGGAKGGSNFDPKGKSNTEIKKFCKAFMSKLHSHIGPYKDIPAGDIGVGSREIGYLYGQYKIITQQHHGTLTGREPEIGGSLLRPEATGYGCVYMLQNILHHRGDDVSDKSAVISGSGNVAIYTAEKLIQYGCKVLTLSDTSGLIYLKNGITAEKLESIKSLKFNQRKSLAEISNAVSDCQFFAGQKPWHITCDVALPCATQNEIDLKDAKLLHKNGCSIVIEGANMPVNEEAGHYLQQNNVIYAPGKIANAGGVIVSGLEMTQNSYFMPWDKQRVRETLKAHMKHIHSECLKYGCDENKHINYRKGGNIAAYIKLEKAITCLG